MIKILSPILFIWIAACGETDTVITPQSKVNNLAKIVGVECKGQPNNYTFSVSIESDETGCEQYADWWEVITPDSILIYRRILAHSHVNEQPFTRSGGVIDVGADDFIYVRAHMNNAGYGSIVFSGTPREELKPDSISADLAASLAEQQPLPDGCDF